MKNLIVFALLAQAAAPAAAGFDLPSMPAGAIAASTEWRQTAAVPYRLPDPQPAVLLEHLHDGLSAVQADHLAGEALNADQHPVADLQSGEIDAHRGAADADDLAAPSFTW